MLDIMNKLTQLSEAVKDTGKGIEHTAEPGGYGRKDDEDSEGNKVKSDAPKKGRGRPKKDADASGEEKKYDTKGLAGVFGGGKAPKSTKKGTVIKGKSQSHAANKDDDGTGVEESKTAKRGLKEYFDQLDRALNEAALSPTQTMVPGFQAGGKAAQPTVIDVKGNPALKAALDKAAQQKQLTTVGIQQPGTTGAAPTATSPGAMGAANQPAMAEDGKNWIKGAIKHPGAFSAKAKRAGETTAQFAKEKAHAPGTLGKQARLAQTLGKLRSNEDVNEMWGNPYDDDKVDAINAAHPPKAPSGQPNRMTHKPAVHHTYDRKAVSSHTSGSDKAAWDKFTGRGDVEEGLGDIVKKVGGAIKTAGGKVLDKLGHGSDEDLIRDLQKKAGVPQTGKKPMAVQNEALTPTHDSDEGAGLGAGRSQTTLEGAKPDFLDVDNDKNKKESWKKAEQDKKKAKTKVKEGMDSRLKAAHHAGKSHALSKQGYNCHYDDMEEARQYHDGFKQGLDECYGQMPMEGMSPEVEDMASYGAHTPTIADEGNAFTGALAKTPTGGKFSVGGKTFTDRSAIEEANPFSMSESMEAWDKELNALLEGKKTVTEGLSVSISKGQQGAPDSVSVTAQDGEADQLLGLLKQAGLGLFGGDDAVQPGQSSPMSVTSDGGPEAMEIGVVDDHDGMMDLIKKVTGAQPAQPQGGFGDEQGHEEQGSDDYADEEGSDEGHDEEGHDHEQTDEEACNECGMAYESCGCDDKEMVDEVESEDQMEYEVAEDAADDSGATETAQEVADTAQANSSAAAYDASQTEEETVEESYANSDDDGYQADMDFMTNVISGGLNKKKATGQSTIPVVASQATRLGNPMQESTDLLTDWKSLAGIK